MRRTDSFEKTLMLGKIEGRRRRGWQRRRWLNSITDSMDYEFEQAPGDGKGQGSLAWCSPQGHKESDMTEQLNSKWDVRMWKYLKSKTLAAPASFLFFCVFLLASVQFSSVAQLCPTLFDSMDCSTPGLPVYHQLAELTQTHVCWVGDAIQPSYPLSSPSPPAFNLSRHQDLFQGVSSLHQVARILEFQLQHQSFQWIFRTDFL